MRLDVLSINAFFCFLKFDNIGRTHCVDVNTLLKLVNVLGKIFSLILRKAINKMLLTKEV